MTDVNPSLYKLINSYKNINKTKKNSILVVCFRSFEKIELYYNVHLVVLKKIVNQFLKYTYKSFFKVPKKAAFSAGVWNLPLPNLEAVSIHFKVTFSKAFLEV